MATYNVQLQVANNGSYDKLNPTTVAEVSVFDKGTSTMVSTNVQDAIVELYEKGR